jgi:putative addiction module component (TIGR02574 family)
MSPKRLEEAALRLTPRQRARLAARLIESLDGKPETGCEEAWLEEAERRYRAYGEGKMKARPAAQVLRDARRKLR